MALTVSELLPRLQRLSRDLSLAIVQVDFDDSYPTGGESFDATAYITNPVAVIVLPQSGYVFEYDASNKKIKAYYADYDANSDGALIEVADEADLSSVTDVTVLIIGTI